MRAAGPRFERRHAVGLEPVDEFLHPDPGYSVLRATSLLLRPSIVTAVITSRAIDMAHLRAKESANYVPRHLLTMSCNQSPSPARFSFPTGRFAEHGNGSRSGSSGSTTSSVHDRGGCCRAPCEDSLGETLPTNTNKKVDTFVLVVLVLRTPRETNTTADPAERARSSRADKAVRGMKTKHRGRLA